MLRQAWIGVAAGAVGTVALNVTTYADMAIRGRPASSLPSKVAGALADKIGLNLSSEQEGHDSEAAQNRLSGLGALMGYVTGLGVGATYGLVRPHLRDVPLPIMGVATGITAMAGSDVPATALALTDPTSWSRSDWALDFGFHLAYGMVTAIAFDAFADL